MQRRALGPVVVINVGYNDWTAVYDVDRVMRALKAAGVEDAIWVSCARPPFERRSVCAVERAHSCRRAPRGGRALVVADWNAYGRGQPWFREDGLHLTGPGATGLARLLRPLVVAGTAST